MCSYNYTTKIMPSYGMCFVSVTLLMPWNSYALFISRVVRFDLYVRLYKHLSAINNAFVIISEKKKNNLKVTTL